MKVLEGINLVKSYGEGETKVVAVNNINVSIERGEFVTIVGTSGSGKSTLLHLLGGLDYATSGKIIIDGRDIQTLKKDELSIFRRRNIGFIFQGFNLVPVLTVYENVVLPINADGKKQDEKFVKEIMESLGIWIKKDKYPNQLSGGQQQRVAIARALVTRPSIVLADEPTGNLDSNNAMEVLELLKYSARKYNQTLIVITHDEKIALEADRIFIIKEGTLKEKI